MPVVIVSPHRLLSAARIAFSIWSTVIGEPSAFLMPRAFASAAIFCASDFSSE
jgi:hypothetical protein